MQSLFPQWLQDLNTSLGIVGFGITVYVMFQVGSIRRSFLSRARLPEIIKELRKAGSALNDNLAQWPSRKNDARSQVKIAASLLQSALFLVPRDARSSLETLHRRLAESARDFSDPRFNNPDVAWDVYSDVQSAITQLSQSVRNLKWE